MSHSSSSASSRLSSGRPHDIPTKCWCGESIVTFTSTTKDNPYRRFYRCVIALQKRKEHYLFQWIDEALVEQIEIVESKHRRLLEDVKDLRKSVREFTEHSKTEVEKLSMELKQHVSEIVEKELMVTKEKMENMAREIAYSTVKILVVVVVVLACVSWLCGKFASH